MKDLLESVNQLSNNDKEAFDILKDSFSQNRTTKRFSSFSYEIQAIINYINRKIEDKEKRSLACGFAYLGLFICVNTKLLKYLIGRCKSSINNGFQQFGYVSVKTKDRSHSCLQQILPSLDPEAVLNRQWTVRYPVQPNSASFLISGGNRNQHVDSPPDQPYIFQDKINNKPLPLPLLKPAHMPVLPLPIPIIYQPEKISKEFEENPIRSFNYSSDTFMDTSLFFDFDLNNEMW